MRWPLGLFLVLGAVACSSEDPAGAGLTPGPAGTSPPTAPAGGGDGAAPSLDGGGQTAADGAALDAAVVTTLRPGDQTLSLTVAGKARTALVHAPASVGARPIPLVLALHGNGDTAQNFVKTSGLLAASDADGFVLVAPQGVRQTITFGGQTIPDVSWDGYRSAGEGSIDLPLFDELRTRLLATGAIDTKKIVVYGYSQGGYASFRWALEASAALSCSAVIAAANPFGGGGRIGQMARKLPFALQIGSRDPAAANAAATSAALKQAGHSVSYVEVPNAGHVPIPGDARAPLTFCLGQQL